MTTLPRVPLARPPRRWLRLAMVIVLGVLVVLFIGLQFIPVSRTNPAVTTQIKWDSPQTQALARRACMDCHSNETIWPWYAYVAPASWLIYYDVQGGRAGLNLSTYGTSSGEGPGNRFASSGDLAYQLGQILAGGGDRHRGPGDGPSLPPPDGGQPPSGQPPQGGPGGHMGGGLANRITEHIQSGEMPPPQYTLIHTNARLTDQERQVLLKGLLATLGLQTP